MIALPGLTLATGRHEDRAGAFCSTFANYVDQGMLPNRFPDEGETPEYNTADATLWYFQSLHACHKARGCDRSRHRGAVSGADRHSEMAHRRDALQYPHRPGRMACSTRGEPGVQLTWMDAKIDDWVVTPRVGKPVEINALWVNALCIVAELAAELGHGEDAQTYHDMAERAHASFQARFWYSGG